VSAGNGGYGFDNAMHGKDDTGSVLPLSRLEADKLLARLASERAKAQQVGRPSPGRRRCTDLLLVCVARRVVPLLLGVGLLVWSVRKLRRGAVQRNAERTDAGRAAVSKVFGHSPNNP